MDVEQNTAVLKRHFEELAVGLEAAAAAARVAAQACRPGDPTAPVRDVRPVLVRELLPVLRRTVAELESMAQLG